MLRHSFVRTLSAIVVAVILVSPQPVQAQRKFAKNPILRGWFNGLDERSANKYMQDLMKEYQIESPFMSQILSAAQAEPLDQPELQGMLVYMAKGLIPSAAQIQFQTVKDEAEFRRVVRRVKTQFGDAAELSGSGGDYVIDLDFTKGIPIPGAFNEEGSDEVKRIQFPTEELEENPQLMARLHIAIHFHLRGNLMFQGEVPELKDMDLPSFEALQPERGDPFDVLLEFDLDEAPFGLRTLLFETVNLAGKAGLQQRDEEEQLPYNARRATGELGLEVLRTIIFDIRKGRFSMQLARDDKPVRIRLNLDARPESNLAKLGKTLGGATTRFGSVRNRPAPLTLATTWGMPQQAKDMFTAQAALVRDRLEAEVAANVDPATAVEAVLALEEIGEVLNTTIESGRTDLMLQLTGDAGAGFAVVGGLRLEEADRFRNALGRLLKEIPETGSRFQQSRDAAGREYVSLGTGEVQIPGLDQRFASSLHFTSFDSCLWFGYGGENSRDLLQQTIAFAEENRRSRIPGEPFQFGFDLSQWLGSDDAAEGFNQYPRQIMLTTERRFDEAITKAMAFGRPPEEAPGPPKVSFLEKALERGGDEVDLRVTAGPDGLNLNLDIGLGVANLLVARLFDLQGRAMEGMMNRGLQSEKKTETVPDAAVDTVSPVEP